MALPRLLLVSGSPGAGKTTLAHSIGRLFPCPVVSRDEVKEGLVHARGDGAPGWGDPIADEAFALFYRVVSEYLRSGCSVVAEAAFFNDVPSGVPDLLDLAGARIVHCQVDRGTANRRFANRAASDPVRLRSHPDRELVSAMEAGTFNWDRYGPLNIGVPILMVDTTDEYNPSLDEIVDFARGD